MYDKRERMSKVKQLPPPTATSDLEVGVCLLVPPGKDRRKLNNKKLSCSFKK